MNKMMYVCAAALALTTSCAHDEVVDTATDTPHAIGFRSVVGLNSRATGLMNTASLHRYGHLFVTTFKEDGSLLYGETNYAYN